MNIIVTRTGPLPPVDERFFLTGHNIAGLAFLSLPVVVMVTSFVRR